LKPFIDIAQNGLYLNLYSIIYLFMPLTVNPLSADQQLQTVINLFKYLPSTYYKYIFLVAK